VQRVKRSTVKVSDEVVASIGQGFLVLVAVKEGDTAEDASYLAQKITDLRVFEDEEGKFNYSLAQVGGEVLLVSQFTLYGDCRKGRRPTFHRSAPPAQAEPLINLLGKEIAKRGLKVEMGEFGARMLVEIENDGPVTLLLDSEKVF
jgi:D-tyrosyl-tRNA(Tyr) deacylase